MPGRKDRKVKSRREIILLKDKYEKLLKIQWKPVKVTPLMVNNRFKSTAYAGPGFSAL